MMTRMLGILLVGGATMLMLQGCPDQPKIECNVSRGPYVAKYTLVSSERTEGTGECPALVGDMIGVEQYYPTNSQGQPNFDISTVALQAKAMGDQGLDTNATGEKLDPDPSHHLYALGTLAGTKPVNDLCRVNNLSTAVLELPEVPPTFPDGGDPDAGPTDPGRPAVSMKYEWSNVRFLVKPATPGEAFSADLTITDSGCVNKYTVNAEYYPGGFSLLASCGSVDPDAGTHIVNPYGCGSDPDPAHGNPLGSQINPLFKNHISCDPDLLWCVLDTDVEHLR